MDPGIAVVVAASVTAIPATIAAIAATRTQRTVKGNGNGDVTQIVTRTERKLDAHIQDDERRFAEIAGGPLGNPEEV